MGRGASEEKAIVVPGRECGACTVCCTALPIETKELRKPPGVACEHCVPQGCAIYETRFPICRTYHCGWRTLAALDEEWRPDRSGVLVSPMNEADSIEFLVLGGVSAIRRPGFAETVAAFIRAGVTAYLAFPGPPRHYSARVLLNDRLADPARRRDAEQIRTSLLSALDASANHNFRKAPDA